MGAVDTLTIVVALVLAAMVLTALISVFVVICNCGGNHRIKATITSVSQV